MNSRSESLDFFCLFQKVGASNKNVWWGGRSVCFEAVSRHRSTAIHRVLVCSNTQQKDHRTITANTFLHLLYEVSHLCYETQVNYKLFQTYEARQRSSAEGEVNIPGRPEQVKELRHSNHFLWLPDPPEPRTREKSFTLENVKHQSSVCSEWNTCASRRTLQGTGCKAEMSQLKWRGGGDRVG